MLKKAALFLVTIALSFSPCVSFRDVSSPALGFVSQAESGLLYKTLKGAAASVLIIRIAQKGLTVLAKKKIAGIIAKFGHEGEFRSTLIAGLEKFRGKVENIDEIIDFVRSKFPTNKIDPPSALAEVPAIGGKAWSRVVNANGVRVYQKADLFEVTPQNLGLMLKGFAPYAKDGEPVVLHHMLQKEGEALAEVSSTMHSQLTKAIHINSGSQIPSGIDRFAFKAWKAEYWQSRAAGLEAVK